MGYQTEAETGDITYSESNMNQLQSSSYYVTKDSTPKDRYKLVYVIFFTAGLGTLVPWNFFITAIDYFQYKLRNQSMENASVFDPNYKTEEQRLFGNYLTLCSMLPLALFNILGLSLMKWISSFTRYLIGGLLIFLMFVLTNILVKIDISKLCFMNLFIFRRGCLFRYYFDFSGAGCALLQGGILGLASILPPQYIKGCLEGQAFAGVLAALAAIVTRAASPHPTTSALAYFVFALVVLTFSVLLTLTLRKNVFFVHYQNLQYEFKDENDSSNGAKSTGDSSLDPAISRDSVEISQGFGIIKSVRDVWIPGFCVLMTLMITLSLFPALLQPVRPLNDDPSDRWTSTFFTPVVIFLSFNVCDWIGRASAGILKWPRRNQHWLLVAICILRVFIIPFSLFLNQQPRNHLPAVFIHDAFPVLVVIFLGLTNGYLMTLAMMYGPSFAPPGRSEGSGVALSIYIALGLAFGVAVSAGLILLI
ncbi:Equilibrative nucleoside transporter 1 [Fasciola hepatica]|uniref:Equilibrative nucleoside transporter 1 n=1 Tax=Fasciola hepatica TaxID=6192 RepID=A0A4E0R827_FASHE|nr:Equilibrative nucleoside transporter 1 [Fasciola hepatica]